MNGNEACTVGELWKYLEQFPASLPCYYSCCSAWSPLAVTEITEHAMVDQRGYAEMASAKYIATEKPRYQALLFPGN